MKMHLILDRCRKTTLAIATLLVAAGSAIGQVAVTTYHNDSMRTGWNKQETKLSPATVNSSSFGLLKVVPLDDQVDAQPLLVPNVTIAGGTHDVVYVATESNTIYAIDASTGSVLLPPRTLAKPVPRPLGCGNNGANVGINGTPTIDVNTHAIYVMVYTQSSTVSGTVFAYELHALDLSTLMDHAGSPMKVAATQNLKAGGTYSFKAEFQRQRPALLDANGNIYAAFGSFCDLEGGTKKIDSRGWLLGWNKTTLVRLTDSDLNNRLNTAPANQHCFLSTDTPCFLSSIWMSGYGPSADPATGDLYFTTGNTASSSYDSTFNFSESVVKLPGSLALPPLDLFTPSNVDQLDTNDDDFGSGGAMVLPDQPGAFPHLAVAGAKDGRLFVLNRDRMGGFQSTDFPNNVQIGRCWCGPSYFDTSSGARVVSSGGNGVKTWSLTTQNSKPALTPVASGSVTSGQDPGFFTSVSSNGTTADTAIIWAVARPTSTDKHVTLYAFNATPSGAPPALPLLFKGPAGLWCNTGGNANLVPTVANGRVYVASDEQLQIFGLTTKPVTDSSTCPIAAAASPQFWGTVTSVEGTRMVLELRNGRSLQVDIGPAVKEGRVSPVYPGQAAVVKGSMGSNNVFNADIVLRAKGRELWEEDREK